MGSVCGGGLCFGCTGVRAWPPPPPLFPPALPSLPPLQGWWRYDFTISYVYIYRPFGAGNRPAPGAVWVNPLWLPF